MELIAADEFEVAYAHVERMYPNKEWLIHTNCSRIRTKVGIIRTNCGCICTKGGITRTKTGCIRTKGHTKSLVRTRT